MKSISFRNREYVKASTIAKKFKYTQDYVGQLCRSGKVEARLVGREWYIDAESVTEYRQQKHSVQKKSATINLTKVTQKVAVKPVLRPKTARAMSTSPDVRHTGLSKLSHPDVRYSSDRGSVIPIIKARAQDHPVHPQVQISHGDDSQTGVVKPAPKIPTVKIQVRSMAKTGVEYTTDRLPEISLQGKLIVTESRVLPGDMVSVEEPTETVSTKPIASTSLTLASVDKQILPAPDTQPTATTNSFITKFFRPLSILSLALFISLLVFLAGTFVGGSYEVLDKSEDSGSVQFFFQKMSI